MNLSDVFQPTTKLRYVNVESVVLKNTDLLFVDGSFLPPNDNNIGDEFVGPENPGQFSAANIEASDLGLARQIMSGQNDNKYECHDKALGRVTAITKRSGFRWITPQDAGNVVENVAFAPGQLLFLKDYLADDPDNWKLTNQLPSAATRWVYAKVVSVNGTTEITVEAVEPYEKTYV